MIDHDLRRLNDGALDHSLAELETDVWRRLDVRTRDRGAALRRVSFQGVVMVLALIGSVAGGINATRFSAPRGHATLGLGMELTPSSLLLGNVR